jgi:H+-translocating NAD(P) transhydrogenase subunit alpha
MRIGVPKEVRTGERRVALSPDSAAQLIKLGYEVSMEAGAGDASSFLDTAYEAAGVKIVRDTAELWSGADIIFKVRAPEQHPQLNCHEASLLKDGQTFISFISPAQNPDLMKLLSEKKVNVLAMDCVPRMSRAQKMDALSSMANIAGYRAIIEAAEHFGGFFTGQVTAAGKIPPAKVMVIGAGVAGLSAIGTANSLGAIVRAFDTRLEVKDQVESLGASFLELHFDKKDDGAGEGGYAKTMSKEFIDAEMALFAEQAKEIDIIITTALIPGKPAPELITEDMVKTMKQGSVIVDLAAEQGGNCKLTEANKVVVKHGVTLIGYTDLPSRLPKQSSQLYSTNLRHLMTELTPAKDGQLVINMEDEVIRGATVIKAGEITWPAPAPKLSAAPKKAAPKPVVVEEKEPLLSPVQSTALMMLVGGLLLLGVGATAPAAFMQHFTVFVLACFVGYMVVWNVKPSLHTPLMSVTNGVSSIIVIGALVQIPSGNTLIVVLAAVAILITSINITGGFAVTQRMLKMFRK